MPVGRRDPMDHDVVRVEIQGWWPDEPGGTVDDLAAFNDGDSKRAGAGSGFVRRLEVDRHHDIGPP
jgi:hypothetical protein